MASSNPSTLTGMALEGGAEDLAAEFRDEFARETIDRYLAESVVTFEETATVRSNFHAVIVIRFARERLRALAQAEGLVAKTMPEVLFVCEHNAGRSQMAAALAHHLADGRLGVRSAGSHPGEQVFPLVVQVMTEIGVDVTHEFPKPLTDEVVRAADAVITMGCGDACPIYPGKHYENWELADPSGQPLEGVRAIRDEIRAHVEQLIAALTAERAGRGVSDLAREESPTGAVSTSAESASRWKRAFGRSR